MRKFQILFPNKTKNISIENTSKEAQINHNLWHLTILRYNYVGYTPCSLFVRASPHEDKKGMQKVLRFDGAYI